jgi:hypothetical protein
VGGLRRFVLCGAVLAAAAGPRVGRADLQLRYNPEWSTQETTSTDAAGEVSKREQTALTQRFLLDLNRQIFPLLLLNGSGFYEWGTGSSRVDGVPGEFESHRWNVAGTLKAGDRTLNGGLNYVRSEQSADALTAAVATSSPTRINETYGAFGLWAVPDLPRVDLRVSRTNLFDSDRRLFDLTSDDAGVNVIYTVPRLDSAYRFRWSNPSDRIAGTEATTITHTGFAAFNDRFLDERLATTASYQLQAQTIDTKLANPSAIVPFQVAPLQGLSAVERTPAVPTRITLDPNPALVDGETAAGAGIDIGYGLSLVGDVDFRDLGAQFPNAANPVDVVYVYVDRQLLPTIVQAYAWQAFRSDDNVTWTPVTVTGPAAFGAFQNRFEIPIARAEARYLKVAVRPLAANLTTDPRWRNVLVTEIQFQQNVSAVSLLGKHTNWSGIASGAMRLQLSRSPSVSYELSAFLLHNSVGHRFTWDVTNGLSLSHPLTPALIFNARADRTDSQAGAGTGHEATTRYGTSLTAQPIPAAMASLAYAGQLRQGVAGTATTNTVLAYGRADPYRGVSVGANAAYGFATQEDGRDLRTQTAQTTASVVPNALVSLNGAYTYSRSDESGAGRSPSSATSQRIDGTLVLTPIPALQGSVTESRLYSGGRWSDFLTFGGSLSLLRGGELVVGFVYNETLDTSARSRLRTWGPNLRWSIRPGAFLDLSYSQLDNSDPTVTVRTRGVFARLFIPLI